MQLTGLHHVTAVTADAPRNHAFYAGLMGMRLVKKTVNQDDTSAYHLFYADGIASPGSDLTFFEWPVERERRGTRSVTRTGLRVPNEEALAWWAAHFDRHGVAHDGVSRRDNRPVLDFHDPEGQRLSLQVDDGVDEANVWSKRSVPSAYQIRGLGSVTISVPDPAPTAAVLRDLLEMKRARHYVDPASGMVVEVYEMGAGGRSDREVHLATDKDGPAAQQGAGCVHHIAFRTPDVESYLAWAERLKERRVRFSGPVDRFYFRSVYFREPGGILIEIATDGPGFATDEPVERLGESLALPPFLEPQRASIERKLKPLDTLARLNDQR